MFIYIYMYCRTAADAALARVQAKNHDRGTFNTSIAAIRKQVKRELEAEKEAALSSIATPDTRSKVEPNEKLAVQGVFFRYSTLFWCKNRKLNFDLQMSNDQ